ncbi:MAG: pilus assembly PilX N-terminal domain-containing protein [Bifidobacteriaceae bacterium]|nr:pilus assembly PilX N-terminal domain-containing protein [Bifidobacteriaceae bacterium]
MAAWMTRRRGGAEGGNTMVVTLVSFLIVMVVVLGTLGFVGASTKHARYEQDTNLALTAAEAGVSDILTELRIDPDYLEKIAASKDEPDGYCQKEATGGPAAEGDAFGADCGWDPDMAPRWQKLGDGDGGAYQEYHYAIVEKPGLTQYIEVTSTGRSRGVYRSVKASISRETTQRWVYFENYSITDPFDESVYPDTGGLYTPYLTSEACGGNWANGANLPDLGYFWQTKSYHAAELKPLRLYERAASPGATAASYKCDQGVWSSIFTFDGPVHSNDSLFATGAKFLGKVTVSDPRCKLSDPDDPATWDQCAQGWPGWSYWGQWLGPAPEYREVLQMPTVADAKSKSLSGVGCLYQGPTRIILNGAEMTVWSKETTENRAGCGSPSELASPGGATVPLPADGLVFVDAAAGVAPVRLAAGAIGGPAGREMPVMPSASAYTGAPPAAVGAVAYGEAVMLTHQDKFDGYGNVWVEGHMTGGNLTIAADRNVIITGDLTTDRDDQDLLGILGGQAVEVHNPVLGSLIGEEDTDGNLVWVPHTATDQTALNHWPTDGNSDDGDTKTDAVLRIEAAIYCASGGFRVQNWSYPVRRGLIDVHGSLAENFPAYQSGSTASGFDMTVIHNPLLLTGRPLLFPSLGNGSWTVVWQEKTTPDPLLKT